MLKASRFRAINRTIVYYIIGDNGIQEGNGISDFFCRDEARLVSHTTNLN